MSSKDGVKQELLNSNLIPKARFATIAVHERALNDTQPESTLLAIERFADDLGQRITSP